MKIQPQSKSEYETRCYHFKPNQMLKFNSDGILKRVQTNE